MRRGDEAVLQVISKLKALHQVRDLCCGVDLQLAVATGESVPLLTSDLPGETVLHHALFSISPPEEREFKSRLRRRMVVRSRECSEGLNRYRPEVVVQVSVLV